MKTLCDGQFYTVIEGNLKGMTGRCIIDACVFGRGISVMDFNGMEYISFFSREKHLRKATAWEELKWRREREENGY